ncbi:UNVERIFIED_CONTAM: Forkhead box protein M1 [Gekko kuhli]
MKNSPHRPLILKRRKLPLFYGDVSSALAGEESGGQGNGSLSHQQARTGSREAPSCELDNSLTNIQWLGKMSSDGLSPCSAKTGLQKENQTPKQEAAVKTEKGAAPSSSTVSWQASFSERPPYSYMAMIQFAINSTEKKHMTLKDIYTWIEDHFPYFKHVAKPGWKNSIRHNLSLHDMFVRETPANSKISFWTIHPEANRYLTLDQVFKASSRTCATVPVSAQTQQNSGQNRGSLQHKLKVHACQPGQQYQQNQCNVAPRTCATVPVSA